MRRNPPRPESELEALMKLRRLSRREALMQLSAFAVGSSALAAACSSDSDAMNAVMGGAGTGGPAGATGSVAGTGAAGSMPSTGTSTANAGVSGAAGRVGGAAGSTGSAAGSSAAGSPAMAAGGAPAAGAPAMTAGGGPAAGSGGMGAGGMGAAGSGAMTPLDSLQCVATPAMTEGPFFSDQQLERSNLVMGETDDAIVKAVPLRLVIGVFSANGMMCSPIKGVHVDIWHADALGVYSDVAPGAVQSVDTRGKKFLRGWQATDESGAVTFDTIWPGWYMSRTIHIHFKLRMLGSGSRSMEFTSQMFFDEAINAMVLAKPPYSNHPGMRTVLNDGDHIYNGTATNSQKPPAGQTPPGKLIMPTVTPMGAGYSAVLKIGLKA